MRLALRRRLATEASSAHSELDARTLFFRRARKHTPVVAVDHEGLRFLVSTADRGLGLRLFAQQYRSDAETLRRALAHLDARCLGQRARERAFLDVGANIGTVCLFAVGTAGFRRAIAVEPEPQNFALLRANAALNFLDDRVDAHRLAAAETAGPVELALSKRSSGGHRLRAVASGPKETIEVEAVSLDDLLGRVEMSPSDIGLVWIDVNGLDAQVLAGAERLLAARVPVVFEASWNLAPLPPLVRSYSRVADLRTHEPDLPIDAIDDISGLLHREGREETDLLLLP
jgi:FkbM family methyltransferase